MYGNSQGALNSWASSRARQLTKDLGACSLSETHMKEPTSTHGLSSYVLLVGMPIYPNAGKQVQNKPQATSREKRLVRESAPSPRQKCLAKLSPNTWLNFSLRWLCPSNLFSLSHASWAACALKGNPRHRASRDLTSRGLTHPPALWSPDSHIPKWRWCSAKRGS